MVEDRRDVTTPFVSTDWLAARLNEPDLQVVDGSWYLPTQGRNAAEEYRDGHIPGAIFFDIDAVADRSSGLPHMLLDDAAFAREAGALGLDSSKTIVVYDGAGLFSAPRVWWTLRVFGAREVLILEGGSPRWKAEMRPLETGPSTAAPAVFHVERLQGRVANLAEIRRTLEGAEGQIVDARPAARFRGEAPEPRPGLRAGHMPGSRNLPFSNVVAGDRLQSPDALRNLFAEAGVDLDQPIIASCGSGVTAAVLVLALEILGKRDVSLYDGSWAEYGAQPDLPVARGTDGQNVP